MATEKEVIDWVFERLKEGERKRCGEDAPNYGGQTLAHLLQSYGWVYQDLRLLAAKGSPNYRKFQLEWDEALAAYAKTPQGAKDLGL